MTTVNTMIQNHTQGRAALVSIFKEILACDDLINEAHKRSDVLARALDELIKARGEDFSEIEAAAFADLGTK